MHGRVSPASFSSADTLLGTHIAAIYAVSFDLMAMQSTCSLGLPGPSVAARSRRKAPGARNASRTKVVAAVVSLQKSSSPLLEGLVAEGIITAEEAAICSPDQLEFLIRKRFRPASSPGQASIQAYVTDGVITQEELEKCSPDQLEFLIRKRTPQAGVVQDAANVVPWSSPSKDKQQGGSDGVNGDSREDTWGGIEAYIANGILTQDEVAKCSLQQLEFLIRKRSPSPPARGDPHAPRALSPPKPKAPPAEEDPEFVQLSLEEYLAQGVVTEDEIENCSPTQLEFLIRKRITMASAAASLLPTSLKRGRSRGPVRTLPVAAVQAAVAAAAAPAAAAPAVEELSAKLVVPRAPPLTDKADLQPSARRSASPIARPVPAQQEGSSLPWAGMAAAGLTVVGLSAGLYFAGKDGMPSPAEPTGMQQLAPTTANAARLADKQAQPSAAAKVELPKAVPSPPAKVEAKKAEAPPPPKVEDSEAAPASTATALKLEPKPVLPAVPKQQEKKAEEKSASKKMAEQLAVQLAAELQEKQQAAEPLMATARAQTRPHPDAAASLATAGVMLSALFVPSAREAIFSRFGGEVAVLKSAGARCISLQRVVEAQQADLLILQDQLGVAQAEYGQALAKLNGAKGALESLSSRVQSTEKSARALVKDLERLPSKEAQRLKGEAASVAASVASQRATVERALQRALKDL